MPEEEKLLPPRAFHHTTIRDGHEWWTTSTAQPESTAVRTVAYLSLAEHEQLLKAAAAEARAEAFEEAANLKVQRRQGRGPGKAVLCEIHLDHDVREALLKLAQGARIAFKRRENLLTRSV